MPSDQSPDPYAAAVAPAPTPPPRRRWRLLGRVLAVLALLLVGLLAVGWWWAGSSTSLATALARAAAYLPAGQELQTRDVSGSLRTGGHIGWLRWSSPGLAVEVEDAQIGWKLAPLLQRQVQLGEVHAAKVTITPQGEAEEEERTEPLQELVLPVQVDLPLRIDQLVWSGRGADAEPLVIEGLEGRYRYDGSEHRVEIGHVALAQGEYTLQATLGAHAPMPLDATLDGTVRTAVPGSEQALAARAHARITGTLATEAARLQVAARLRQATAPGEAQPEDALSVDAQAQIAPWAEQPVVAADARFQALDLAALWPQAPATGLSGTASVQPEGEAGWRIGADVRNSRPGPWDKSHLPVAALRAEGHYDGDTLRLPAATLEAGGGRVSLQGSFSSATQQLQGEARVQGVDPARLHSRLAPAPLSGTASADGSADGAVRFRVDLRAAAARARGTSAGAGTPAPIALQQLSAQGRWQDRQLELRELVLAAQGARVQARTLQLDVARQAARGRVQAELPGATARLDGDIAARSGAGVLELNVADAQRAQAWLEGLAVPQGGWSLQGRTRLELRWRGGWQAAQQQLQAAGLLAADAKRPAGPGAAAPDFTLQAQWQAPRLHVARAPGPGDAGDALALDLSAVQASVQGSLRQLDLELAGQVKQDAQQARVQLQASAGSRGAGRWQGELRSLQLQARLERQPGPWELRLTQPVALTLQQAPRLEVEASGGSAQLRGPAPGNARLHWQPLRYARGAQGGVELRSQGGLEGLPLAWAEAFQTEGQSALERLGLSGDLQLVGQWDIAAAGDAPLRARVRIERASGDLYIDHGGDAAPGGAPTVVHSSGDGAGSGSPKATTRTPRGTAAGLREAALELQAEGEQVQARLSWDSERAGQVRAEGRTQLQRGVDGGWLWPEDAPLAASIRAEMPEVGVWSMLAPSGWRVHGTLNADVRLSGSRAAPRWDGQVAADRFAIRSVLDGVDLQDGRLRATLQGQQLTITELHLKGGHGSRARIAGFSGNRTAAPEDGGTLSGSGTLSWAGGGEQGPDIRMDLRARAERLQVLVRADRQVSVSGDLRAQLQGGQLVLRGDLRADRATIILPEAGAPSLGDDVVVRSAALDREAAERARQEASAAQAEAQGSVQTARPPDIALTFDLGDDFAFQGRGVTTRLTGRLQITSRGALGSMPRVTGEVHTDQGRYRAWGQALDVESGLLRFNGPYDNPSLDVLALRPNIPVRAGVQVTGAAQAPRAQLYSEPELPDAEKLSWVVLGRSAAAGGAEAALLQQAALAFLAGEGGDSSGGIAQRLGLDEIGFKGPGQGEDASGAALTFGKRLSQDLYVTYEKSLSGTLGVLYIFYDLSKRLTLRGQTGTQSAVDLIYTVRWD